MLKRVRFSAAERNQRSENVCAGRVGASGVGRDGRRCKEKEERGCLVIVIMKLFTLEIDCLLTIIRRNRQNSSSTSLGILLDGRGWRGGGNSG